MIEMTMLGVQLGVMDAQGPDGTPMRILRVQDQSGICVLVPMEVGHAVQIGNALIGSGIAIAPANAVPPAPGLPKSRLPR